MTTSSEKEGVGISCMKPFSGGQLLSAEASPFGQALTPYQCIHYALDKPGVLTVLPGAQSVEEIDRLLDYYEKTEEELDYSMESIIWHWTEKHPTVLPADTAIADVRFQ